MRRFQWLFVAVFFTLAACQSEVDKVDPVLADINNRGVAAMGQFRYDDAVELFEEAVAKYPGNNAARVNLGIATLNRQAPDDAQSALRILEGVLERDEENVRALYVLGILHFNAGEISRAKYFFETVTELDREDGYAQYFLGQTHFQQDEPQLAYDAFKRSAELVPNLRSAHYGKFQSARRLGKRGRARQSLARYRRFANNPQSRLAEIKYTRMGPNANAIVLGRQSMAGEAAIELPEGPLFGEPVLVSSTPAEAAWAVWLGKGRYGLLAITSGRTRWFEGTPGQLEEIEGHPLSNILQVRAAAFGDVDNNGFPDLYLARTGANQFWRQSSSGWQAAPISTGVQGRNLDSVDVRLFDADHDGDLDIFVANTGGANELYNNNRDGSFTPLAESEQPMLRGVVPSSRSVLLQDIDRDRDLDLMVLNARTPNEVFLNDRAWQYHEGGPPWANVVNTRLRAAIAVDVTGTGVTRLFTIDDDGLVARWGIEQRRFVPYRIGKPLSGDATRILIQDLNGDGRGEFVVVSDDEWVVASISKLERLGKRQQGKFLTLLTATGGQGPGVVSSTVKGIEYYPPGSGRLPFMELAFSGRDDSGAGMRSNASAIGTKALVHVRDRYASISDLNSDSGTGQSLMPASIGLGGDAVADMIEIEWPDGVLQVEEDVPPGLTTIAETQRQLSSCPVLFAWNGKTFEFVSDILGVGGLGAWAAPGKYAEARPEESFAIPEGVLELRDGRYSILLAEPMEEVAYVDHMEMDVIDLPPGVSLTLDERAATGAPQPTGEVRFYRDTILPVKATVEGQDVTSTILTADRTAAPVNNIDPRFLGLLERSQSLVITFDQDLGAVEEPVLVFDGWIEYGYSQTTFAAWQANVTFDSVTLEGRTPGGEWQLLLPSFGYPAGMPRQSSVPLMGLGAGIRELRLTTNQQIYWDRIAVVPAVTADAEVSRVTLEPTRAKVRRIGFPNRTLGPQRQPDFDFDVRHANWDTRYPAGDYTALGAGLELVREADDALAIIGPGDALEVAFSGEVPELPDGWTRRFVLRTIGWCKDMDLYTEESGNVGPLPARGKPTIARSRLHERYNTRYLSGR